MNISVIYKCRFYPYYDNTPKPLIGGVPWCRITPAESLSNWFSNTLAVIFPADFQRCFFVLRGIFFKPNPIPSLTYLRYVARGNRDDFNAQGFWNLLVVPRCLPEQGVWVKQTSKAIKSPRKTPPQEYQTRRHCRCVILGVVRLRWGTAP